jgi:hypothetical protein
LARRAQAQRRQRLPQAAAPPANQVAVIFSTSSAFLSHSAGVLTLATNAPAGSTQIAAYRICESTANTLCSGVVNVIITVPATATATTIVAVVDSATLAPGGTLNLLVNDSINVTAPLSPQVSVTFNSASAFLSQIGGVLTLAAGAPGGSRQTATYSICQLPANSPCSATVGVTITLNPGGTLNLLANDSLNGAVRLSSQVAVTFNTASAFLSQTGGVLTLLSRPVAAHRAQPTASVSCQPIRHAAAR